MKNLLLTAIVMLSLSAFVNAQNQEVISLNEISSEVQNKTDKSAKIYYKLNAEYLSENELKTGTLFQFAIDPETNEEYEVTRVKEYYPGYTSVIAKKKGNDQRVMSFTYHDGGINGLLHVSHDKSVTLSYDKTRKENFIQQVSEQGVDKLACGLHDDSEEFIAPFYNYISSQNKMSKATKGADQYQPALITSSIDDSVTIDLMLVYTNAARDWASSSTAHRDIFSVLTQAMTLSQVALDNSKTGIELRLVHVHRTSYDEVNDGVESGDRLRRLTQDDSDQVFPNPDEYRGHMEEVHDLRDEHGADIVSLIARIVDTGGIGWRLGSTGGNPKFGFNLNRVQQVADGYTLIHEIGHNMGNTHSRTQESSGASEAGGLFHYSVGYQDSINDFHTVMSYADGLTEAPIFSSPDLTWQGKPTGTNNTRTPENNALSLREIKKTISGYRNTMEESPVVALSTNDIEVDLNREDELKVSVDISNSGESNLMWDVDFDFPGSTVAKQNKQQDGPQIKPVDRTHLKTPYYNYADNSFSTQNKKVDTGELIYESSFEASEGFTPGSFLGQNQWRSMNDTEHEISGSNPKTGSQHLRLAYSGGSTKSTASPFFGYRLFGNYEVTINFSLTGSGALSETFDFYIYDGKTGDFSSGVIISNGLIFPADLDESGEVSFEGTETSVTTNTYHELKIIYNTNNESIDYYYDGNLITSNSYLKGFTPGVIEVLHRNEQIGTAINVDDIRIEQLESPYSWLAALEPSGVVFNDETGQIDLEFSTVGVESGTYETVMKVKTNDPANPLIEVPITLNVGTEVSNEVDDQPVRMELAQNYPNPFNPTTNIRYTLESSQKVELTIYNMQGQKVTTLQNGVQAAGNHTVTFNASNLASGVYMYQLKAGSRSLTRQMVLIK